jgi:hypothetical protein
MCVDTATRRSRTARSARIALAGLVALAQRREDGDGAEHPPIMSFTGAPARNGLPTGPVMYARPLIICTTSSSAVRFS